MRIHGINYNTSTLKTTLNYSSKIEKNYGAKIEQNKHVKNK